MLGPYLDERQRRVFATSEALAAGWGGIAAVSRITRIARSTIGRGLDEVAVGAAPDGRGRRAGGGRKPLEAADPRLIEDLERILTPPKRVTAPFCRRPCSSFQVGKGVVRQPTSRPGDGPPP